MVSAVAPGSCCTVLYPAASGSSLFISTGKNENETWGFQPEKQDGTLAFGKHTSHAKSGKVHYSEDV